MPFKKLSLKMEIAEVYVSSNHNSSQHIYSKQGFTNNEHLFISSF